MTALRQPRSKRTGHKVSRAGRDAIVRRSDRETRPQAAPCPAVHYTPRRSGRRLDAGKVCAFAVALVSSSALTATPWDAARAAGLTAEDAIAALLDIGAGLMWLQDRLVRRMPRSARISIIVHQVPGYEQARAWPEAAHAGAWNTYVVRTYSRLWMGPFLSTAPTAREAGVIAQAATWWPKSANERRIRTPDEGTVRGSGNGRNQNGETETIEDEPGETTWGEGAPFVLDEIAAEHHRSAGTLHGAIALRLCARTFTGADNAGIRAGCTRRVWTVDQLVRAALDLPTGAALLEEDRMAASELTGWRLDASKFADDQISRWQGGPRPRHARITPEERTRVTRIFAAAKASGEAVDLRGFAASLRISARTLERILEEPAPATTATTTALAISSPEPTTTLYAPEASAPPAGLLRLPSGAELPVDALDHCTDSRIDRLARLDAAMRTKG